MGREVLDDADVADAVRERADALGRDQEDLAELAVADAPAQLEQRRVAALDVADGGADARRPRSPRSARARRSAVAASGFSISTCDARRRRARAPPRRAPRSAPRRSAKSGGPRRRAAPRPSAKTSAGSLRPRRSGHRRGRRHRRTRHAARLCSSRAWWRPIMPEAEHGAAQQLGVGSGAHEATRVPAHGGSDGTRTRPVSDGPDRRRRASSAPTSSSTATP